MNGKRYGKRYGKPIANAMANGWQSDGIYIGIGIGKVFSVLTSKSNVQSVPRDLGMIGLGGDAR